MRINNILELLQCPVCQNENLEIHDITSDSENKVCSFLKCPKCSNIFIIQDNILSLVPIRLVDKERELNFLKKYAFNEDIKSKINDINSDQSNFNFDDWKKNEKQYWDHKRYSKQNLDKLKKITYNRMFVRKKHIIDKIRTDFNNKVLLEFGGGNGSTIYNILNPEEYGLLYINTDISFSALKLSQELHPKGYFIQCDACYPPFRPGTIDLIFEFGTLHHLPDNIEVLKRHIKLLRTRGFMGIHEPINQRKALLSQFKLFKKLKSDQSEHNEFIDYFDTNRLLLHSGKIVSKKIEYSPVRSWLMYLIDLLNLRFKYIILGVILLDNFIIKTLGKYFSYFKGNSILLLFQRF